MNNGYETNPYQQVYISQQIPIKKKKKSKNVISIVLMILSFLCFVVFVGLIIFYNTKENKNNIVLVDLLTIM